MAYWARYTSYDHIDKPPTVAERKVQATIEAKRLRQRGETLEPVLLEGRKIAATFWGKAWCENLERYSDYSNRLPRGRSYVRSGSVIDLKIGPRQINAQVRGSRLYQVTIALAPLDEERWQRAARGCANRIDSLVELLSGRLPADVIAAMVEPHTGLFPAPAEIKLACSCPDWATMCKHVAATLYGVGARLDRQPELFFVLRDVDQTELIRQASPRIVDRPPGVDLLDEDGLSALFGIELDQPTPPKKAKKKKAKAPVKKKAKAKAPARRPKVVVAKQRAADLEKSIVDAAMARILGHPAPASRRRRP